MSDFIHSDFATHAYSYDDSEQPDPKLEKFNVDFDKKYILPRLREILAANPSNVPTLWEQGLWDHEDMYGAIHAWEELQKTGQANNNFLLMGPWRHSGFNYNGSKLGELNFEGDTALQARRDILLPFFNAHLKDGSPAYTPPAASILCSLVEPVRGAPVMKRLGNPTVISPR